MTYYTPTVRQVALILQADLEVCGIREPLAVVLDEVERMSTAGQIDCLGILEEAQDG